MPSYEITQSGLTTRDIDVLVLGGGMAGSFAAMAARDSCAGVVLIEPTNALGGQGTTGGVAGFCGDTQRVNGLFSELVGRLAACGRIDPYDPNDDRRAYDLEVCAFFLQELVVEKGVELWLHAKAIDARAQNGLVTHVLVACGASLIEVRPKIVIDATGNAVIPDMIGLETVHLGARKQLPMSLYFTLWDTHRPVLPFLPPGCPDWESDDDLPMTSLHCFADGRVEVKMKVVGFDAADGLSLSQAEIHARRQMMGLIHYLQTKGYRGRHAALGGRPLATHVLASVSRAIGQREGRRIIGRRTITDAEARSALVCDDAIAVGTYHLDYHWTGTEKRAGTGITDMVEPYHIPLGALIPQGVDNVICPGRSLSGDQLAMSSYRVMATCAQTGFGAGVAAALAARGDGRATSIDNGTLQDAIEAGGQSLDLGDYGDYLRCLRFSDEEIPLPPAPPASPRNASRGALSLARVRHGGFLATRIAPDDPTRLELALRSRAQWHPLPADAAKDFPEAESAAGPTAGGALDEAADCPGFVRFCVAETRLRSGHAIRPALMRSSAAREGYDLVAFARAHDPDAPLLIATIAEHVDGGIEPACIATTVGCAILFQTGVGTLRFWEGPIERFAAVGAPAVTPADLKGRPYQDHLILSAS